ncbi:glycine cleavage system protein GcvH [Acetobacterium woodii]|uniref:Glycine cleavage system H protein n=1 Tax=Acetobacterium woodii (strain ATCC 29683 / DSM 1030 / JCM 2381 / KCTC 1655 / WB1) TaxID=931626 RepID=H6LCP3_ACEWD|nr:glycine cleavage system protein GcvH [Acetobacterium woodii]AFA49030.1 glycine cleavage system H protein GcvH2 [Acetobacterium woodii DSM 1030]
MSNKSCVLPCNGLDKCAGDISRRVALQLAETDEYDLICPVLLNQNKSRYEKVLETGNLTVIDGCNTRCASKLAGNMNIIIKDKINVSELAKAEQVKLGVEIRDDQETQAFVQTIVDKINNSSDQQVASAFVETEKIEYDSFTEGKFVFKVPKTGYFFNENDCWVAVSGNIARIGVSDYAQQNLSDILYVEAPEIGLEFEQFDDLGSLESSKAVFEVISPVAGIVVAVNDTLSDAPEQVNESPYEKGWLVEVKLTDFEEDQDLLHGCQAYFELLQRKVAEADV